MAGKLTLREAITQLKSVREAAEKMMVRFAEEATPADMLKLGQLARDARAMERKAELAGEVIASNQERAMEAMRLREKLLDEVIASMKKTDQSIDALVAKLVATDDPQLVAALAGALAKLTTRDQLSPAGTLMSEIKANIKDVDLEF